MELNVDFSDNADAGLFNILPNRKTVKVRNNLTDIFYERTSVRLVQIDGQLFLPFFKEAFGCPAYLFVRTRAIQYLLQCIAVNNTL